MEKPNSKTTLADMKKYIQSSDVLTTKLGRYSRVILKRKPIKDFKKQDYVNFLKRVKEFDESPPPKKQAGGDTVAGEWDPFKSKNAPYNKWTPCLVFNYNGKNPKLYECYYVKKQKHELSERAGGGISSGTAVWIKSISGKDKGDIIAVGDMGQPEDVRPTHFRFSRETINFPSRIFEVNQKPRLIKNQPKKIQDYYKKPEYKNIVRDGDMTWDIVQKLKIKDGARFIKIKRIPEIIKTNVRLFKASVQ